MSDRNLLSDIMMPGFRKIARSMLTRLFTTLARPGRLGAQDARVNGFSRFNERTRLGLNFNTNGLIVYGAGSVTIGNNFHSGSNVKIYTSSHNYNGTMAPYDRSLIHYEVVIDDQVWLGSDVTIVGNVRIGEGAIVQVGSVVSSDIPKFSIAGGNPARVFKSRDITVYQSNIEYGRFH